MIRVRLGDVVKFAPSRPAASDGDVVVHAATSGCLKLTGFDIAGIRLNRMRSNDVTAATIWAGEVLVGRSNTGDLVGRASVAPRDIEGVVATDLVYRIQPGPHVRADYLAQLLNSLQAIGYWVNRSSGASSTMKKVTRAQLDALAFDLPSINEQARQAARVAGQLAAAFVARMAAATRGAAVTDVRRCSLDRAIRDLANDEHVPRHSLASLAHIQTGYAFRSDWFRNDGIRLLRNANVGHLAIDWSDVVRLDPAMESSFDAFRLHAGDIVLALDRPIVSTGLKVARVTDRDTPSLLLQRVARLTPREGLDPDYLFAFMLTTEFETAISGHDQSLGVPHVSPRQVGAIELPLPNLEEQSRIAAEIRMRLDAIDAMTAAIDAEHEAIEALPAALLRRAFHGLAA